MCAYNNLDLMKIHTMAARALDQGCETVVENTYSTSTPERNTND
jgi:hypothetical protein